MSKMFGVPSVCTSVASQECGLLNRDQLYDWWESFYTAEEQQREHDEVMLRGDE